MLKKRARQRGFPMSVQFGSWEFRRSADTPHDFGPVANCLRPYGPDGDSCFRDEHVDILFYRFCETEDASREEQPYRVGPDQILTWDGRLDNRAELRRELAGMERGSDTDVAIVAAAYRRWGLACLPKLLGDWALSIWDSVEQELVLAKDFLGTRSLFYTGDKSHAQWCSVLDPLVLFAGRQFQLNLEYLAGWFGLFPASHLTPYTGVYSVPPASYVVIRKDSLQIKEFWRFANRKSLVYRKDAEYEKHFLELFEVAVRRRLRSPFPVFAELSGGMDSSSIVCMADRILAAHPTRIPRLDTVTYHSSGEPNWNELPYVEKVEARRGRTGYRIEVGSDDAFHFDSDIRRFMATPGSLNSPSKSGQEFSSILRESGTRILLSGIGGDEVLGGAPSPAPILANLLAAGRLRALSSQLVAWGIVLRRPFLSMLLETLSLFCRRAIDTRSVPAPAWLCPGFLRDHSHAIQGYPRRTRLFGPRPSFQESVATIDALRRQLSSFPRSVEPSYHKSYPYLDRDLLDFLFSVPPDQLLRPGQRRSLMRRALAGIVPNELLHRKRKAFVIRGPLTAITSQFASLTAMTQEMIGSSLNIVDPQGLAAALNDVRSGGVVAVPLLIRVFGIERWLRNAAHWNVLEGLGTSAPQARANIHCRPTGLQVQNIS
jgi:asparagine synthase (glutamine-hydrolysing)